MDFLLQLAGIVATAAAVYGSIRADLHHVKDGVKRAHERIDEILMKHD